jgi:hypothetical protein
MLDPQPAARSPPRRLHRGRRPQHLGSRRLTRRLTRWRRQRILAIHGHAMTCGLVPARRPHAARATKLRKPSHTPRHLLDPGSGRAAPKVGRPQGSGFRPQDPPSTTRHLADDGIVGARSVMAPMHRPI